MDSVLIVTWAKKNESVQMYYCTKWKQFEKALSNGKGTTMIITKCCSERLFISIFLITNAQGSKSLFLPFYFFSLRLQLLTISYTEFSFDTFANKIQRTRKSTQRERMNEYQQLLLALTSKIPTNIAPKNTQRNKEEKWTHEVLVKVKKGNGIRMSSFTQHTNSRQHI